MRDLSTSMINDFSTIISARYEARGEPPVHMRRLIRLCLIELILNLTVNKRVSSTCTKFT